MIASFPEHIQKKHLDEITAIISEALEEAKGEEQFQRGNSKLVEIAGEVTERISKGNSQLIDIQQIVILVRPEAGLVLTAKSKRTCQE